MVEFINLNQGGTSVHEYSLKFTKLLKYAPSLAFGPRDEINHFMTGMLDVMQEDFHLAMVHENMNISPLMVHV